MSGQEKLGTFLKEVSNWGWDEFVRAEKDKQYTSNEAIIFALVRACSMQKIDAIRIALNRLDGKLKTPIRVEYPKIFYLFPNASLPEQTVTNTGGKLVVPKTDGTTSIEGEVLSPPKEPELTEEDLPSLSLRDTLAKLSDYPRELPEAIIALALQTEQWLRQQADKPDEIPKVKSVVAAHLLIMAQKRNIDAFYEVFDQIDGKLAETIQLLGDDLHIISYLDKAPEGAYLNADGVVEIEAQAAQDLWMKKLEIKQ